MESTTSAVKAALADCLAAISTKSPEFILATVPVALAVAAAALARVAEDMSENIQRCDGATQTARPAWLYKGTPSPRDYSDWCEKIPAITDGLVDVVVALKLLVAASQVAAPQAAAPQDTATSPEVLTRFRRSVLYLWAGTTPVAYISSGFGMAARATSPAENAAAMRRIRYMRMYWLVGRLLCALTGCSTASQRPERVRDSMRARVALVTRVTWAQATAAEYAPYLERAFTELNCEQERHLYERRLQAQAAVQERAERERAEQVERAELAERARAHQQQARVFRQQAAELIKEAARLEKAAPPETTL